MRKYAIVVLTCLTLAVGFGVESLTVAQMVGEGPSLIDESKREGTVVKPFIMDKKDEKLFRPRMIWADSWQFIPLPILNEKGEIQPETPQTEALTAAQRINQFIKVQEWYNQAPPDLDGKYVLIEFSASWCPACKRAVPFMEHWNEKFDGRLVVISILETDRAQNDNFPAAGQGKTLQHCIGIDTQRRSAKALGVYGIPHSVLIEPKYGAVVWEGMTEQKGYELTDELVEKILAVGEKMKK